MCGEDEEEGWLRDNDNEGDWEIRTLQKTGGWDLGEKGIDVSWGLAT